MTEDEMVGWHHRLNGHEFDQTPEIVEDRALDVLQSVESQTVRRDIATGQQQQSPKCDS